MFGMSGIDGAEVSTAPALGLNVWMRRRTRTRIFAALAVACSLWFVATALVVVIERPGVGEAGIGLFLIGVASAAGMFARRLARAGLWIAPEAIIVRGPGRTWVLAVDDVERFVPGIQQGLGNGTPCPMLRRANGHSVGVWALGREGLVWRFPRYLREMEPGCEELNRMLKSLQAAPQDR
jgi:hypothetical protein